MKRGLAAMTVLIVFGTTMGVTASASAEEPEDTPPAALAETLEAAASAGADTPAALNDATGLPATGPGSLAFDAEGRVSATVLFDTAPDAEQRDAVGRIARIERELSFVQSLSVSVDAGRLGELAAVRGVVSVTPVLAPLVGSTALAASASVAGDASCREFPSDAAGPLRADLASELFGVDGTGITIGVISDSYAGYEDALTTPEQDIAAGLLPGEGNPCGYTTPVEVLGDTDLGTDEGRAMAQLVHAIAPGARILFLTGTGGQIAMANAVYQLAQAGADVVVDDLSYSDEPRFQQGVLSAAISDARSHGIAYYTSAGNWNQAGAAGTASAGKPITSWQTTDLRTTACPAWVVAPFASYDCLDFDTDGAGDATDTLFFADGSRPLVIGSWNEPVFGVRQPLLPQLYVDDGTGPAQVGTSGMFAQTTPVAYATVSDDVPALSGEAQLVVVRDTTADAAPSAVWLSLFKDAQQLLWREHDTSAGAVTVGLSATGHSADGSAVGVAAASWRTPTVPEDFTAPGAGLMYFEPVDLVVPQPSAAYPVPVPTPGPQLASVDANRTNFFGEEEDGELFFYGTSAAAPNAAAVHALAEQYARGVGQDVIVGHAVDTAVPLTNPYSDYVSDQELFGAGLIDAVALLGRLPAHDAGSLSATATSATTLAVEWEPVVGAAGYSLQVLDGDRLVSESEQAPEVTSAGIDGLVAETAYTVRLAALNALGEPGTPATAEVSTPRPPQPAVPPAAPAAGDLGPDPAPGLSASPAEASPGDEVTVTGLPARTWVYGWLFSDPASLGWAWTGATGTAVFTVPADAAGGAHRLALSDADGALLGWAALRVTVEVPAPAALPATGQSVDLVPFAAGASLLLAAGAGLVVLATRRRRA